MIKTPLCSKAIVYSPSWAMMASSYGNKVYEENVKQ
jgi:hypothetical protein